MSTGAITDALAAGRTADTGSSEQQIKADPLGRDAFLTLLVTQLENQNPLEPQADGEFLAQLAQFSSLESLQQIKSDIAALRSLVENTDTVPATSAQGGQ